MKLSKVFRGAAVAAVIGLWSTTASAATVLTFYGDWTNPPPGPMITYDANDDRGSLLCSSSCSGLLSNLASGVYTANVPDVSTASGFGDQADLFYISNSSDASELAFTNTATGASFASGSKTEAGGVESYSFFSDALYLLFKIGANPNYALIMNTSGLGQTYTYTAFAGEGAGLSHTTEYGETQPVPVPAGGLLLLTALGGVAAFRRRKTA